MTVWRVSVTSMPRPARHVGLSGSLEDFGPSTTAAGTLALLTFRN